jgi:hypothetical protein
MGTLAFVPVHLRYGVSELMIVQPGTAVSVPPSPELRRMRAAAPKFRLAAPVPLHVATALLAIDACNVVAERRIHGVRDLTRYGPPAVASWWASDTLRTRSQERSARRLGVTPETMPVPRIGLHVTTLLISWPVTWLLWRHRRRRPYRLPLELQVAMLVIREFNRRRSWRRAYAAARASQDLSSASSSTSGVCAPDTP